MRASLDQHLIALAAAVGPEGPEGVLRVLRDVLRAHAPFEAAEVALAHAAGFQRFTLTDDEQPVAAEDLLLDVSNRPEVRRFDEPAGLDVFPRSRERLVRRGLKSLLVLPLSQAGGGKGAVVLARDHTFGFMGASLRVLVPVAAMAGLAIDWARALARGARGPQPQPSRDVLHAPDAHGTAESEATILLLRAELERQHALTATLTAERDAAVREIESLREAARGVFGPRRRRR